MKTNDFIENMMKRMALIVALLMMPFVSGYAQELSQVEKAVEQAKRNMDKAASELDFNAAAKYRDEMWALQQYLKVWKV